MSGRRIRAAEALVKAVVGVAVVGAAACSAGDEGHDRADYIGILSGGVEGITDEESTCMSSAAVDTIGVDALEDADVYDKIQENPDGSLADFGITLTDEQQSSLYDDLDACKSMRELFQETLESSGGLSPALAECVVGKIDDATFERIIMTTYTQGDDALDDDPALTDLYRTATTECADQGVG